MKRIALFICLFLVAKSYSQYAFSGQVDTNKWQNTVYLSLIEDYRQLSGMYAEQIIAKTTSDSLGYFQFSGDQLDDEHRIYRLHVDNCAEDSRDLNHFTGDCPDSREVLFIAKNTDSIQFPLSFNKEMFCDIRSSNEKALALIRVDSLKEEMGFAFSEIRSTANKKLNTKKWFETLQAFGTNLNEPLAELYIYAFLSDRSNEFYDYYLNDLTTNSYYDKLEARLINRYPNSIYLKKYSTEIASDKFTVSDENGNSGWPNYVYILIGLSVLLNILLIVKLIKNRTNYKTGLTSSLSKQEQKILDHILEDLTNKDIAERMFISVSTVKTHINNIYKKLNVQSREEVKKLFKSKL
ncbi:MAG: winged helix-turn-helix transcriptional regulator [Bacteroidia bacterium]|nr:winged helix-turn-helix transcriptional regulator [Bacteroidia bacterium]NND50871.1 response regulator transcription factor [Flavobacteriaceae bacterium]